MSQLIQQPFSLFLGRVCFSKWTNSATDKAVEVFQFSKHNFYKGLSFLSFLCLILYAILSLTLKNFKTPQTIWTSSFELVGGEKKKKKIALVCFWGSLLCNAITALNMTVFPPDRSWCDLTHLFPLSIKRDSKCVKVRHFLPDAVQNAFYENRFTMLS